MICEKKKALAWLKAKQNYCLDVDWTANVLQSALEARKERRKSMLLKELSINSAHTCVSVRC